ncbi:MAG TPA: recombinase family protein [Candidatus Obscuribacterales bacterium]
MRASIYIRVSTADQQTLPLQLKAIRDYLRARKWKAALEVDDIGSGVRDRKGRERLMRAAQRREIDTIVVWKLDRWGRSLHDLVSTLQELSELEVGFVSITEAIDLTTSTGRAMAGMLAVFAEFEREILRERVKAGIKQSRSKGRPHGRPKSAALKSAKVKKLFESGYTKAEIARRLGIGRTSVIRILATFDPEK